MSIATSSAKFDPGLNDIKAIKEVREISIFDKAWSDINPRVNSLPLCKIHELLSNIEIQISHTDKFLTEDVVVNSKVHSLIKDIEKLFERRSSEILVLKKDMAALMSEIFSEIKIIDYDNLNVYGNFNDRFKYYQDDYKNVIIKQNNTFPVIGASDVESDDYDETASLMETKTYKEYVGSPSSIFLLDNDVDNLGYSSASPSPKVSTDRKKKKIFNVGEILQQLEESHKNIKYQFNSYEDQLNTLKTQNENDLLNLHKITDNNNKINERIGQIRNDLMFINLELDELKRSDNNHNCDVTSNLQFFKEPTFPLNLIKSKLTPEDNEIVHILTNQASYNSTKSLDKSNISTSTILIAFITLIVLIISYAISI